MPELPDVEAYLAALRARVEGEPLERVRLAGVSLLKTYDPPISAVEGRRVTGFSRLGKRLVWELEDELLLVLHLMIAGRLRWRDRGAAVPRRGGLAAFDFPGGTVLLTEAGTAHRASLHVHRGRDALAEHDRGGVEPLAVDRDTFAAAVTHEHRTLKRALTDPRLVSGIGNAYSDEILHRAGLSPVRRTHQLTGDELTALHAATREVLGGWTEHLTEQARASFPEQVTAFRPEFAVHGRHGEPCPACGDPVQRIRYADTETNYCATCQTGGRVLADRARSRVLKDDWPRSVDELD